MSADLGDALKRPDAPGDIEFATGIAGRFCANGGRFTYYGPIGIQLPTHDIDALKELGIEEPYRQEYQLGLEIQALRILSNEEYGFGKYFFDLDLLK